MYFLYFRSPGCRCQHREWGDSIRVPHRGGITKVAKPLNSKSRLYTVLMYMCVRNMQDYKYMDSEFFPNRTLNSFLISLIDGGHPNRVPYFTDTSSQHFLYIFSISSLHLFRVLILFDRETRPGYLPHSFLIHIPHIIYIFLIL